MKKVSLILSALVITAVFVISCDVSTSTATDSRAVIYGTSSDESEPWLNIRENGNSCSKRTGRIKDGSQVNILEENGDFVKIETIPITGYVHKNYLTKLDQVHSNPEKTLLEVTEGVLHALTTDIKKIRQYVHQDSIRFFYWKMPTCEISNLNCKSLEIKTKEYWGEEEGRQVRIRSKELIHFAKKLSTKYMNYGGTEYMPAAGFGGGSVSMPDENTYTITIRGDETYDELWFLYRETDLGYTLVEIGIWKWTP